MPLTRLNRSGIEGYLAHRRDEGLAKASRNRYLATLRVILAKGVEWGYLRRNPADGLRQEPEGRKLRGGPRNSDSVLSWTPTSRGRTKES